MSTALTLETREQADKTVRAGSLMLTPSVGEDYWSYRVRLTDRQAIIAFPKFGIPALGIELFGIGFAVEEDWNTNFPSTCTAEEIYEHIAHNFGDDAITREDCLAAIGMIQDAIKAAQA